MTIHTGMYYQVYCVYVWPSHTYNKSKDQPGKVANPARGQLFKPPYAIGSDTSLSGHAIAYRWHSLPRVRRHRASKPQGSSKRVLPWQVTMCVGVFSSHSFWTSMDVPAGVTQEEGHTGFLIHLLSAVRALIFLARRIQPFLSFVDREVEFCVLTI